jgi:hypothetical protein
VHRSLISPSPVKTKRYAFHASCSVLPNPCLASRSDCTIYPFSRGWVVSARAEGISSEYLWYQVIPKMEGEGWCGLAVRTRDGTMLGAVVGVFVQGPLAGRLRVQGTTAAGHVDRHRRLRHPAPRAGTWEAAQPGAQCDADPSPRRMAPARAASASTCFTVDAVPK